MPQAICTAIGLHPGEYIDVFARDCMIQVVKMDASQISGKSPDPVKSKACPSGESIESPTIL